MMTAAIAPRSPHQQPLPRVLARVLATTIAWIVLSGVASAQVLPTAAPETVRMSSLRLQRLSDALQREVADGRLPGAVVAIARRGKLVYHEAFGRLRAGGPPMPKDAIFQIASMTKPLTTVAALMLQEEGRLLLNDPVDQYLPELSALSVAVMSDDGQRVARTEPLKRQVKIADLFQHTAGFPNGFVGSTDLHLKYRPLAPAQNPRLTGEAFLAGLRDLPLHFQPGTEWEYGWGIDVAGLVLERITGQSLDRLLAERLFGPLGMTDTGFVVPASKAERYVRVPEEASGERAPVDATVPRAMACGGACAVSTAMDYLRFAQMLLNRGVLGDTRLLSRKSVEAMTVNQLGAGVRRDRLDAYANGMLNGGYGFGLGVAVRSATGVAGMMGTAGDYLWGGAVGTYFWVDPQEELAVVFMTAAPPEGRLRPRQLLPALVLQAIVD